MNLAGGIILQACLCVCRLVLQPERRGGMLGRGRAEAVMHGRADSKRGGKKRGGDSIRARMRVEQGGLRFL